MTKRSIGFHAPDTRITHTPALPRSQRRQRSPPSMSSVSYIRQHWFAEVRGGTEAALQGASGAIGPVLLFLALLGPGSLSAGLWAALVTATVVPLVSLLFRGSPGLLGSPRTASLTAYAAMVVQLALAGATDAERAAHGGLTAAQLLRGLSAGSLMFALASGLVLLAGQLRLGRVFKLIPTPVTAGISNGTALTLMVLAIRQVAPAGGSAILTTLAMLLMFWAWTRLQGRVRGLINLPAIVMSAIVGVLFSAGLGLEPGQGHASASLNGEWLALGLWQQQPLQGLNHLVFLGLPGAVTLALVMMLETFTAASQMQTRFGLRVDADRELMALGAANLVSAALGGVPCTGSPVRSVSNWRSGGRGVLAALLCLTVTGTMLLVLENWLLALPAGLAAGLLLLQASAMVDPTFIGRALELARARRWFEGGTQDLGFWIIVGISLVGFFGNLIWACFVGIGVSCLLVLRRVSGNLTAHWTYLDSCRSHRIRHGEESTILVQHPYQVAVLQLTGHLFFGNSTRLMQLVDELHPEVCAVVLDVSRVHDVDPSGSDALLWLIKSMRERGHAMLLSGLQQTASAELRHVLLGVSDANLQIDLDRALEAAEDLVLERFSTSAPEQMTSLESNLLLQGLTSDEVSQVQSLGRSREVARGTALFMRDAVADGVWLLLQGQVSILAGNEQGSARLATFGAGQFVGEMSLIDGKTRSASAYADSPVMALLLDAQGIAELTQRHPDIALKLMRNIARELSNRVRTSTALLTERQQSAGWAESSLEMASDQRDQSSETDFTGETTQTIIPSAAQPRD